MLSDLQAEIARIVADVVEQDGFALAGGAALISRGEVQRETQDLDFFGLEPASVDSAVPKLVGALTDAGFAVAVTRQAPGFARLSVERDGAVTELDIAADARLFPVERGPLVTTLSGEELAVDKVLAVFGRAQPRDFVDLLAVEHRYGIDRLMALARSKDSGFRPDVFADMLSRFKRLRRQDFDLADESFHRLENQIEIWREHALHLQVELDRGVDLEPDTGLGP